MSEQLTYREHDELGDAAQEEEEDEIDESGYKAMKDAVLFAIEVSTSMLLRPADRGDPEDKAHDRDCATAAALKCAYQLMQQRIITNPKDMMGILLFGTEQSKFEEESDRSFGYQYPHCYLLADLNRPEADDIKRLRTMVQDEGEAATLLIPSKEPVAMSTVLFCANQIFTTKAANFSSRRLFLVTDNDNPHPKQKDQRSSATVRARDLWDLGVTIELFPISRPDHDFDRTLFYDDIIYRSEGSDPDAPALLTSQPQVHSSKDGLSLLQSLTTSVMSRNALRRAQFANIPFELSPELMISVNGYIVMKRQAPAKSCWCFTASEKAQIVEGTTVRSAVDSGRTIEKPEIRSAFKFGGETVTFSPEELKKVKHFGNPIIRLIGFKPLSALPLWANMTQSTFLFPSEEGVVGSTRTFSALYQSLLRKRKMAVCWFIARRNASPIMCAIVAGDKSAEGEQKLPAGLWLIKLPFADDIRNEPERSTHIAAPDALVDEMRQVIQQLQLPKAQYDPFKYPNPSLQWHYRVLQAMALDEDVPEKPSDATVPKYRQIDKRAGAYVLEWGTILDKELQKWQQKQGGRISDVKRPGLALGGPAPKKSKLEIKPAVSEDNMRNRFNKSTISQLTITVLKDFLSERKVKFSSTSKKAELVEVVESYFENKKPDQ